MIAAPTSTASAAVATKKRRVMPPAMIGTALLLMALAAPVTAAPPERFEEHFTIAFPDEERGLVILVNTTRADYCTPDVVAWELAVIQWQADHDAWDQGGQVGPEPPFPPDPASGFPEGNDPIETQQKETGQGAIVFHQTAKGLDAEIWPMVDDAPLVGPCTDTDAGDTPLVGTANYSGNDNDRLGSGTRGNAFGDQGSIVGRRADGKPFKYSWRFHTNTRCFAPEDGPPACFMDTSSFR